MNEDIKIPSKEDLKYVPAEGYTVELHSSEEHVPQHFDLSCTEGQAIIVLLRNLLSTVQQIKRSIE